jgi:hypothetical protein
MKSNPFTMPVAALVAALSGASASCSGTTAGSSLQSVATLPDTAVGDQGALCEQLVGRFVGLPGESNGHASAELAPLAGRLWLRSCQSERNGGVVRLKIEGSAWYFLDHESDGFRIRQPVAFRVATTLSGEFGMACEEGVLSVHFRPTERPSVDVQVTNRVNVQPQTLWASVIDALPFLALSAKAQRQIGGEVASQFRGRLAEGATLTFDLRNAEADAALGRLAAGQKPRHPFEDGVASLANERQLLYPGGIHVLGPFEPDVNMPLDVIVEQGSGLSYQTACADDVRRSFAGAEVPQLDPKIARTFGTFEGIGHHSETITLEQCTWYLMTAGARTATSVVALRLRPGTS